MIDDWLLLFVDVDIHLQLELSLDKTATMDGFSVPEFQATQDEGHVFIDVRCVARMAGGWTGRQKPNIAVEGRIFGLHFDAYYLPLVLPGSVTRPDSDAEAVRLVQAAKCESSSSKEHVSWRVTLNKVQPGEHFDGLEQVQPQLLPEDQLKHALMDAEQSKGFFEPPLASATSSAVGVRAVEGASVDEAARALLQQAMQKQGLTSVNDDDGEGSMEDRMPVMQNVGPTNKVSSVESGGGLGFGFGWKGSFGGALIPGGCADKRNVLEVCDPKSVDPVEREKRAIAFEEERWDEGIYMDNFLDIDDELAPVLRFQPTIPPRTTSSAASSADASVDVETIALVLQLVFAYSYDERTNQADPTVESGWTIAKLSRCLSSSVPAHPTNSTSLESVILSTLIGCVRRALTMPLYRHWQLAIACIHDTLHHLDAGQSHLIDCLVAIESRLKTGQDDVLCRLAEIWLAPLIAHVPTTAHLDVAATCIRSVMRTGRVITKENVGQQWDLQVLEEAAQQAYQDGEGGFV